ncbi:MAG: ZIP family metal transporter [Clostridiaceae bacterium]|nr:ZIP family metal transporter [Clostridiaceae bacterium]
MRHLMEITLTGFAAGMVGTGLGGLIAFVVNKKGSRFMSFIIEFSAGLMMAVVCFDLLPHSFELGGLWLSVAGVLLGVITIIYLEDIINKLQKDHKPKGINIRLKRIGILMMLGIAVHNFPEGLAVGSGFEASVHLGLSLTLVMALHDIPEGMAMAVPMKASGMATWKVIFYAVLTGVPTGFGALVGALLGEISKESIALCLSFAAGAMLYVVCGDLIPESKSIYRGRLSTIGNILGIIIGIIISVCSH